MWKPPARNFDGIQFEAIRKQIDAKFNEIHDRLSAAYYNRSVFDNGEEKIDFGKMREENPKVAKELFDKLHALIFFHRDVEFHEYNTTLPANQRIAESEYNEMQNEAGETARKSDLSAVKIAELKNSGVQLSLEAEKETVK